MQPAPVPSGEETRANRVFDALLWAMSRPGLLRELPETGAAQIAEALVDRECKVYAEDPCLVSAIVRTGAEIADIAAADHLFFAALPTARVLRDLRQGSDLYPDDGATLVLQAAFGVGALLRFEGPGIDGHIEQRVGGLPDAFWHTRREVMRYPMGFELLLLDGSRVLGVPRSTRVVGL